MNFCEKAVQKRKASLEALAKELAPEQAMRLYGEAEAFYIIGKMDGENGFSEENWGEYLAEKQRQIQKRID